MTVVKLWNIYFCAGKELGSFFYFHLEHSGMADGGELLNEGCDFNCTRISQETTGRRDGHLDKPSTFAKTIKRSIKLVI